MEQQNQEKIDVQNQDQAGNVNENSNQQNDSSLNVENHSEGLNEEKRIEYFEILKLSWQTFKNNWKFLLILVLIYSGINFVEEALRKDVDEGPLLFLISIFIFAFNAFIAIGFIQIFLRISRGQQAEYNDIFGGAKYFWRFVGGSILYGLIVLGGYLLLIIPGIIWQYKYSMFSYLIVDKDMQPMDAIKESGKIMYGFKWKLFVLQLLMVLVILAGALLLGIGLLVAIPVVTLMSIIFYRIISGERVRA